MPKEIARKFVKENTGIGNLGLGELFFNISLVKLFDCLNYLCLLLRKNKNNISNRNDLT